MLRGLCPKGRKPSTSDSLGSFSTTTTQQQTSTSSTRVHNNNTSSGTGGGGGGSVPVSEGCLVKLKNGPPCDPNTFLFFSLPAYGPKIGKTVDFIEKSNLDPQTLVLVKILRDPLPETGGKEDMLYSDPTFDFKIFDSVETIKICDLVFLDDSPAVLGRVVAIDNQQAVVDVSYSESAKTLLNKANNTSTMRVYKLSDLEACVDGSPTTSFLSKSKTKAPPSSASPSPSSSSPSPSPSSQAACHQQQQRKLFSDSSSSVSRHVAGIVQHRPVAIVTPDQLPTTSSSANTNSAEASSTRIRRYTPLAVHATDEGPVMLLERNADGKAFLLFSSHSSTGPFIDTSFMAVGSESTAKKSPKPPNRCTVEEESLSALEGGLVQNRNLTSLCKAVWNGECREEDTSSESTFKYMFGSSETNVSGDLSSSDGSSEEDKKKISMVSRHSRSKASFVSCPESINKNLSILLLKDINGILSPISKGLSLTPGNSTAVSSNKGLAHYYPTATIAAMALARGEDPSHYLHPHPHSHAQLSSAFSVVSARLYATAENINTLMLVLG